ncbi:MAG TPA: biotin transporter BioY [Symbiobacteriaceae bacterium]|nr:biotin transporter BioY [Symbiobacteriaceae bacterium]
MRRYSLLVLAPLMTAITVVLGLMPPIPMPFGVPITLQTLGVMLAGLVLGAAGGGLSQVLLLLLVAVGAPVLAGGKGGLAVFAGPTAGYLIGWAPAALVTGLIAGKGALTLPRALIAAVIGGVGVVYLFGIPWTAWNVQIPLWVAAKGALVFVPLDLVKAVAAAAIALPVRRAVAAAGLLPSSTNRSV